MNKRYVIAALTALAHIRSRSTGRWKQRWRQSPPAQSDVPQATATSPTATTARR